MSCPLSPVYPILLKVLEAKFEQSEDLKWALSETGEAMLVEAAFWDKYWGIGIPINDYRVYDPKRYLGKNRMGVLLMCIRQRFFT